MGSAKRQRQRENRMRALAEAERAKARKKRSRSLVRIGSAAVAVVALLFVYYTFLAGDDEPATDETTQTVTTSGDGSDAAEPDADADADAPNDDTGTGQDADNTDADSTDSGDDGSADPAGDDTSNTDSADTDSTDSTDSTDGEAQADPAGCPPSDGSGERQFQFAEQPPTCIDLQQRYTAVFDTSMGSFKMVLDPSLDPVSVNNFVVLARHKAFDGTIFHRVIEDFVIQGGDVQLQYGTGTPGYRFTGGFPDENWYRIGSVAMANSGDPSSNGSQFFVITGPNGAALPALYSPIGQVVDGLDVALAINSTPTHVTEVTVDIDGAQTTRTAQDVPVETVTLHSVTVSEATPAESDAYDEARS